MSETEYRYLPGRSGNYADVGVRPFWQRAALEVAFAILYAACGLAIGYVLWGVGAV